MPLRHAGNLDMADAGDVPPQGRRKVALDELAMVQVALHHQVGCADFPANSMCLILPV